MAERRYAPTAFRAPTVETHSAEWHELRRQGIGGSDVSVIMGMNRYMSALELWELKTGKREPDMEPPSEPARWGTTLEPVVLAELQRRMTDQLGPEHIVAPSPGQLVNVDRPWQRCNPDGIVRVGRKRVGLVESKTAREHFARDWEGAPDDLDGGVSPHALWQVHHSMSVTGYEVTYVAVLLGGSDFRWRRVTRDAELEELLLDAESNFWQHVINDTPPPPDGSESAGKALLRLYSEPVEEGEAIELDSSAGELLTRHAQLSQQLSGINAETKRLRGELTSVEQLLEAAMGNHQLATFAGEPVARWKDSTRTYVDSTRLRAEAPELFERYAKSSTSRRLTLI